MTLDQRAKQDFWLLGTFLLLSSWNSLLAYLFEPSVSEIMKPSEAIEVTFGLLAIGLIGGIPINLMPKGLEGYRERYFTTAFVLSVVMSLIISLGMLFSIAGLA